MSSHYPNDDTPLEKLYLSTNVIFECDDLFYPLTLLSTKPQLDGYQRSPFPRLQDLLKRFWIITAANPFSQELSRAQNEALNEKLEKDLKGLGLKYELVTCTSADATWTEQSFAVSRQAGIKNQDVENLVIALAGKYLQNSVFSFAGNTTKILPVLRPDIRGQASYYVYEPA